MVESGPRMEKKKFVMISVTIQLVPTARSNTRTNLLQQLCVHVVNE